MAAATDDFCRLLRGLAAPLASFDGIGDDPAAVRQLADTDLGRVMATAGIPREWGAPGLRDGGRVWYLDTSAELVVLAEEACRVSLDAFMAMPGPSMSGVLVRVVADDEQRARYYSRLLDGPTWTFFALTEPDHGSDATAVDTRAVPTEDGWRITGTKCYVGNAARGDIGVVFARTGTATFAVDAFLVDPARSGYHAAVMDTRCVRGAQYCTIDLDDCHVDAGALLGAHRPRSQRGIRGALRVFHALRPVVAAMSLGVGLAALDEVGGHRLGVGRARLGERGDELRIRSEVLRELVAEAAVASDAGRGALASAAKVAAHEFARAATRHVGEVLGVSGLLEHPRALRALDDSWGLQFMEGTVDMQLLHVFQGLNSASPASSWNHGAARRAARTSPQLDVPVPALTSRR